MHWHQTVFRSVELLSRIPASKNIRLQWLFCVYPQAGQVAYWPPGPGHWADTPGLARSAWLGRHHQSLSHQSQPTRDLQLLTGTDAAETTNWFVFLCFEHEVSAGPEGNETSSSASLCLCCCTLYTLFFSSLCKSTKAKKYPLYSTNSIDIWWKLGHPLSEVVVLSLNVFSLCSDFIISVFFVYS